MSGRLPRQITRLDYDTACWKRVVKYMINYEARVNRDAEDITESESRRRPRSVKDSWSIQMQWAVSGQNTKPCLQYSFNQATSIPLHDNKDDTGISLCSPMDTMKAKRPRFFTPIHQQRSYIGITTRGLYRQFSPPILDFSCQANAVQTYIYRMLWRLGWSPQSCLSKKDILEHQQPLLSRTFAMLH